jgi:phosphatidylglycerophosphate synthase
MGGVGPRADVQVWLFTPSDAPRVETFALTGEERLRRSLTSAGVAGLHAGPKPPVLAPQAEVAVFRTDVVYDERLVRAVLDASPIFLLTSDTARMPAAARTDGARLAEAARWLAAGEAGGGTPGPRIATPDDLVPSYSAGLRSVRPAHALRLREGEAAAIERALFAAAYKDVTDFVTKKLWPRPALAVTRVLARAGVSPNLVTLVSWILVALATWWFARGEFGAGLLAAWCMTFLDTVDGKLARVTLRTTRVGHVFDHGLDLLHPPIWYLAWGAGLALAREPGGVVGLDAATWITVVGYVVGRAIEGLFLLAFKFEIHTWQPVDSWFRLVTARRNPNLVLLTAGAVAGRPDLGMAAVAAWTLASIAFHTARIAKAAAERWSGAALRGWQEPRVASAVRGPAVPGSGALE